METEQTTTVEALTHLVQSLNGLVPSEQATVAEIVITRLRDTFGTRLRDTFGTGGTITRQELQTLLSGQKIQTIKMVRSRTGLSLKDAKYLADSFQSLIPAKVES